MSGLVRGVDGGAPRTPVPPDSPCAYPVLTVYLPCAYPVLTRTYPYLPRAYSALTLYLLTVRLPGAYLLRILCTYVLCAHLGLIVAGVHYVTVDRAEDVPEKVRCAPIHATPPQPSPSRPSRPIPSHHAVCHPAASHRTPPHPTTSLRHLIVSPRHLIPPTPSHPIPMSSHPILPHPTPYSPVSSPHPFQSRPIPPHAVPPHPTRSQLLLFAPIASDRIPS